MVPIPATKNPNILLIGCPFKTHTYPLHLGHGEQRAANSVSDLPNSTNFSGVRKWVDKHGFGVALPKHNDQTT